MEPQVPGKHSEDSSQANLTIDKLRSRLFTSYLAFSPQVILFSFAFPLRLCVFAVKIFSRE
jgi:hypothetical protein